MENLYAVEEGKATPADLHGGELRAGAAGAQCVGGGKRRAYERVVREAKPAAHGRVKPQCGAVAQHSQRQAGVGQSDLSHCV